MLKDFKEIYKDNIGKNLLVISHGSFLNDLICLFTNNIKNASSDFMIPSNNSLTVLEFQMKTDEVKNKEYVDASLVGYNLKLTD